MIQKWFDDGYGDNYRKIFKINPDHVDRFWIDDDGELRLYDGNREHLVRNSREFDNLMVMPASDGRSHNTCNDAEEEASSNKSNLYLKPHVRHSYLRNKHAIPVVPCVSEIKTWKKVNLKIIKYYTHEQILKEINDEILIRLKRIGLIDKEQETFVSIDGISFTFKLHTVRVDEHVEDSPLKRAMITIYQFRGVSKHFQLCKTGFDYNDIIRFMAENHDAILEHRNSIIRI